MLGSSQLSAYLVSFMYLTDWTFYITKKGDKWLVFLHEVVLKSMYILSYFTGYVVVISDWSCVLSLCYSWAKMIVKCSYFSCWSIPGKLGFVAWKRCNVSCVQEIAELYEQEQNLDQAISYYEKAADLFQSEDVTTTANQCKQKVAQFSAQIEK